MTEAESALAERVLAPPLQTAALTGIGGTLRARLEDFEVHEEPAYGPDHRPGAHLLVPLAKRGLSTEDAVREVARQLSLNRSEIGVAGKKDRDAVTEQWVSLPASAAAALPTFEHDCVTLGAALPHGNKLRIGHLAGNRFVVVVRDTAAAPESAVGLAEAKLAALAADGGLLNAYGGQRFPRGAPDVLRGLAELRRGKGGRRGNMVVAGGQAALFNLYVAERAARGALHTVLAGDLLRKTDTGGLFWSDDPHADQGRLDRREVTITGPIFGSKMRAPPPDTAAAALEADVLGEAEIEVGALKRLGRAALGTRRNVRAVAADASASLAPATDTLAPGIRLAFGLPPGAYATLLARELMLPSSPPSSPP